MHPILLRFGSFTVYSYGAMVALGFSLATLCIYMRASSFKRIHREGRDNLRSGTAGYAESVFDKDKVIDLMILMLVTGIIGARLAYAALNLGHYISNPIDIFNLSKGGLVWYGGFLSALLASTLYAKANRRSFWEVADLIIPFIALGQAVGRLGCFLNGCCYGIEMPSEYRFAVIFPGEYVARYPTQFYSSIALLFIFIMLRIAQDRRRFDGEILLWYCMLYSCNRFLIEFLRGDNPRYIFNFTLSQILSVFLFFSALAVLSYKVKEWRKRRALLSK